MNKKIIEDMREIRKMQTPSRVKEVYNKEKNTWTMHYGEDSVEVNNEEYIRILEARAKQKRRIDEVKKEKKQAVMRRMFENKLEK